MTKISQYTLIIPRNVNGLNLSGSSQGKFLALEATMREAEGKACVWPYFTAQLLVHGTCDTVAFTAGLPKVVGSAGCG